MFDYETLDIIADSYLPLLAVAIVYQFVKAVLAAQWFIVSRSLLLLVLGLLVAYGLMFVDQWLELWPKFQSDYSTHTAVALVLTMVLASLAKAYWKRIWFLFLMYLALMRYQDYHNSLDMITSFSAVLIIYASGVWLMNRLLPKRWVSKAKN
ncbi:MAG: hypothetical protein OEY38_15985 [Gammaproteobacteria bacterium]|nr:hypothetical protein [Gammaproteobacteria bacterium]